MHLIEQINITKVGFKHYAAAFPFFIIFWIWQSTLRFKYDKHSAKIVSDKRRMICLAWHNRIFFLASLKRIFRRHLAMSGLVSASKDGAYLAAFFKLCNIGTVRGSYMRRGAGAIRDLVKTLEISDVAITPDGPRGPVHVAKRGFLMVAKISDVRIVLLKLRPRCAIKITKAWDCFAVPLPFSAVDFEAVEYENYSEIESLAQKENLTPEEYISKKLMY